LTYIPTIWKEHSMSPSEKLAGLQNAETIYSSLVSYLDSYFHDSSYYLKTEADAKFFGLGTGGSGSGLVAEFLDGMTAQQILDAGFPSGGICGWAGSEAAIPGGFDLCSGSNGTPNLRGRILVSAGGSYTRGQSGGLNTAYPSAYSVTIASHAITADELPPHTHGYVDYYRNSGSAASSSGGGGNATDHSGYYTDAATSTGHDHPATFSGEATDIRPAFMALCLICKR